MNPNEDPLAQARGCLYGLLIAAGLWIGGIVTYALLKAGHIL